MAEAMIGPLLGTLQELAMKEARAMVAVNDDVRSLRDKLMWMQAFLRDAEPQRRARNDELTRVYLHQIRDAVDRYFLQVDLSMYPSWRQVVLKVFKEFTTHVRVRCDLSKRIRSINLRLESIIENKGKYRIDTEGSQSVTTWRPSTVISAAAGNLGHFVLPLVGRQEKEKELKKALSEPGTKFPMVITVTGKSGVGKTKLVKEIYEQYLRKEHFEKHAWVSFAKNLSASNIMKLILLRLTEDMRSEDPPGDRLKKELQNEKYLLVLDGEITSSEWDRILVTLSGSNAHSRIVRFTQMDLEEPAARFEHTKIVLDHLKEVETTNLFLETLLVDKKNEKHNGNVDQRMADVKQNYAESIFKATGGLPLAIVLLAGLLRTKENPGEWENVFKHLNNKSNEQKQVDIILSMCFDDLPHDLKSCFLYFATFPVNMLIRARTMVCMWMAEGFLRPKEGKTMEKVGHHYLSELVHRRLMNLPPVEYAAPGFERVTVQSRVHDFLLLEAQEASFVEVHNGDDVPTLSTTRRLSLQNHTDKVAALATPLPKLRSIFSNFEKEDQGGSSGTKEQNPNARACPCLDLSSEQNPNPEDIIRGLLRGSKFLRVISLDGLEIGITLPHEIGDVAHLQFLGITSCSLKVIPRSIGKLTRLQTLDVRSTKVTTLPTEFWKIRALRHVFGLVVLPRRVGHLEQLQNLTSVKPDTDGCWDIKTFARMKRLRALCIEEISNVHALSAIYKIKYLELLILVGKVISWDLFTESKLPRLQVMRLNGKIEPPLSGEKPFTGLQTVTKLILINTRVSQFFIDQLGKNLPLLAILTLLKGSYEENHLVFKDGFHSLKELTLNVLLKRIVLRKQAFPHLVKLDIFVHSVDLCIDISDYPDIRGKITVDDKYLHYMMNPHEVQIHRVEDTEDQL